MITIVNYGMGNLASILNMLRKVGVEATLSSSISDIEEADKLILPGVGAFQSGMKKLNDLGFVPALNNKVIKEKTPILGICLGMQLFTKKSEEGDLPGLGWIDAETIRFKFDETQTNMKVPHMGWNVVKPNGQSCMFNDMPEDPRFYFVHSYHVECVDKRDILSTTHYGYDFVSSVQRENIIGCQFHPEKSHKFGFKFLKNFVELF